MKYYIKHLSGILEGMSYSKAVKVIEGLVDRKAALVQIGFSKNSCKRER